jgi:hypothetical protein
MSRKMPMTWRFDLYVQMPSVSSMEDVRANFIDILDTANTNMPINELDQSSFSYDMPQDDAYQFNKQDSLIVVRDPKVD